MGRACTVREAPFGRVDGWRSEIRFAKRRGGSVINHLERLLVSPGRPEAERDVDAASIRPRLVGNAMHRDGPVHRSGRLEDRTCDPFTVLGTRPAAAKRLRSALGIDRISAVIAHGQRIAGWKRLKYDLM